MLNKLKACNGMFGMVVNSLDFKFRSENLNIVLDVNLM